MREVTSEYLEQVQGAGRQFGFQVKVYGNAAEPTTLWLGDIISIDVLRSISDKLQLGACLSDKLTLQTSATTLFGGKGKKIEVYYRCTAPVLPWSKLGTFYVDSSVTREGVTAVTAYDMMNRLGKKMSWVDTSKATAPTFPCKMQQMLKYICDRFGFTTDFTCEDITVEKAPDGYTAREIISYIAASHGANARFSPSEVLRFSGYTQVDKTIEHGRCFSFDSGEKFTVNGLLFSKDDSTKIYIDDSAREYDEDAEGVVEVFNPFATVAISEYAWGKLGNLSYNAISLEMPAENILEPGDVFTVREADGTEKTAIVMEQQLSVSCSDGFVEKISCDAESKNQTRNSENRAEATEKKVNGSGNAYATFRVANQSAVKYDKIERGLLSVDFSVDSADSDVLFSGNQLCTASGAWTAEFIYKVDGAVQDFKPAQYLPAGKHVVPHIFPMNLTVGKHNFAVCMLSQDGTGLTAAGGLLGALSGIISGIREQTPPNDDLVLHFSGLPAGELTLAQNMIASSSAKKYVDWGDGSDIEESTANAAVSHTYGAAGDYVVTIKTDALNFGRDTISAGQNSFIGTAAAQYLTRVYFPDNAAIINFYGANDLPNLETLVFGNSATAIRWNFGSSQNKVTSLLLPETVQHLGFSQLNRTGIISLIIPKSVSSWNSTNYPGTLQDFRTYSAANIAASTAAGLERLTIGGNATATGVYSSKKLVSVKFPSPNKVTNIGSFSGCSALSDIVLPASVTSIASYENCSALPRINIPAGISEIKNNTFKGCSSLASVLDCSGLTAIGNYAFQGCAALTDITFPDGLTSIGISAFNGCSSPFSPGTPSGLASVGASAFMNSGITDFVFRSGCSVGKSAFSGSKLVGLTIEDGVATIPESCFQNTKSLGSVAFPGSLTTIAASAFTGSGITDVSFGDGALSIGNYAFAGTALSKVTIPSGVVSVGREAFQGSAIRQLSISGNPVVDTGAFRDCLSLTIASMGALKSIPTLAFSGCSNLSSFQLGAGITIGGSAFTGCGFTALSLVSHLAETGGTTTYGGKYAIGAGAFQNCAQLEFVDGRAYKWNVGLKYTESSYDSDSRTWSSTTTDLGLQEDGHGIYDLLEATEDSVFKGTKLKELSAYPKPDNVITDTYKKIYSVYHFEEN